jgi:tyrosyl-tRNA synthetase
MRNIQQGGVRIDGERVTDRSAQIDAGTFVLQVGKRKFARVTLQS